MNDTQTLPSRLFRPLAWLLFAAPLIPVGAADWPTFRGPDRSAVAPEKGLLKSWPEAGPPLVWESAGAGRGYASVSIADGKLYTLGDGSSTAADADEYLSCYDQKSGKPLWATKTGEAWNKGQESWQSSRGTPTIDAGLVYVVTPSGNLICCDADNGSVIWSRHLVDQLGGKKGDGWGYSESVLVDGDRVICTPGGESATMVALDKKSGETIWQTAREGDRGAGHSSIVISQVGGQNVYVQLTASGPMGVAANNGKLLWVYDIDKTTAVIPTPIIRDDLVFFSVGYKRGGALLRQVPGPNQSVSVDEIYGLITKLSNKHGGVVLVGDYVYGDSDSEGAPFCAELMTGEQVWKSRGAGEGSAAFAAAEGMLYIQYSDGVMVLAKASPKAYEEVGQFQIPQADGRPTWAHPVILDGLLYIRSDDQLFCYDIRQ
jgi:outer membrane protein assembly factor BamB